MTEEEYKEAIDAVCMRPKLYTPTGSFFEVVSFIDGLGTSLENQTYHSPLTPFGKWLGRKFGKKKDFPLDWNEYLEFFPDNDQAVVRFQQLFEEFFQTRLKT